jgi:hypothetical protein
MRQDAAASGVLGVDTSPRSGVPRHVTPKLVAEMGGTWHAPTPDGAIPTVGRVVVAQRGHLFAVVDGVVRDTFNPTTKQSERERRDLACVGFWTFPVGTDVTLSAGEAGDLRRYEAVVRAGLKTFVEVGRALAKIRAGRLYRAEYPTFEEYVSARWDMKRAHAYRVIGAAAAVSPIGDAGLPVPANEGQARELAKVADPAVRVDIWRVALDEADGKPTAAAVRALVKRRTSTDEPAEPEPVTDPEPEQHTETIGYDEAVRQGGALVDEQCGVYSKRLDLIAAMVSELAADNTPETVTLADERAQWRKSISATVDTLEALFDRLGAITE